MIIQKIKKTASGSAAAKDPNVTIVAVKDILSWPARNSKKVLMAGAFTLAPNAKIAEIYLTSSKTKAPYESDGDEDAISIKQKFEGEHPGSELEINEFIADWLGEPCIIIHGSCQDAFRKVVGTKCAPVQLKPSGQDDNDARKHMLVFEQFAKTEWLPGHYLGQLPSVEPATVANVETIVLDKDVNKVYQLPSLAVTKAITITGVSAVHGDVFTLIGGGGVAPATLSNLFEMTNGIMLIGGTNWIALAGATISLRVIHSGSIWIFEETSRT